MDVDLEVFEGPLDLLLHLVKKHEIDLYDIPVAFITQQYIDYLNRRGGPDLDADSRWLVMAADLVHIKARLLLPREEDSEDDAPDPREKLAAMLGMKRTFRGASFRLADMADEAGLMFRREARDVDDEPEDLDASLYDLAMAMVRALGAKDRRDLRNQIASREIRLPVTTVGEKIELAETLLASQATVALSELVGEHGVEGLLCSFLALLDMAKSGSAAVCQPSQFGEVYATRPGGR